jgi:hypothetical protein
MNLFDKLHFDWTYKKWFKIVVPKTKQAKKEIRKMFIYLWKINKAMAEKK